MAEGDSVSESGVGTAQALWARLASVPSWLDSELWRFAPEESPPRRFLRSAVQLLALTIRGFQSDRLLLRASALTYFTALSIIPMLGVVIAILGAVGGDETLVEFVIDQLTTVAPEARETVRAYANGLDFQRFGTIGGAIVFGTSILALRHLETTLNDIWGVVKPRSWARRFSDYLAVIVVAPVSTGIAVSLATTLQSGQLVAWLLDYPTFARVYGIGLEQVPVVVLFVGFTFLFWFFPNTQVRVGAAALGGIIAAVLFAMARTIYVDFQIGAATYQAVFGAISAIPLILAWLYACWAILLLGAEVAFATQNLPFARREMRSGEVSMAEEEAVALEIVAAIGRHFLERADPPTAENLADALEEPVRMVRRLCEDLERADLLRAVQSEDDKDSGYVPAGPLYDLSVGDVLRAVRGRADHEGHNRCPRDPNVARMLGQLDGAWSGIADDASLQSLCAGRESDKADRSG